MGMTIHYDDDVATSLVSAADGAAQDLRRRSVAHRLDVELAVQDFDGAYARLFTEASVVRSEDGPKLGGVLEALADQVTKVTRQAAEERERQAALAAWTVREAERDRERASGDLVQQSKAAVTGVFDHRPSDTPVRPAPVSATFSPRSRGRSGGGPSTGRSSADPERLRTFAGVSRAGDLSTGQHLVQLKNAWSSFVTACSWAPVGSQTAVAGFEEFLAENATDADWISGIATAFDEAGGGSLSDTVLDLLPTSSGVDGLTDLLTPGLTPAEVAAAYTALGLRTSDLQVLPLETQYRLANLDGIPAVDRDVVSRAVLAAALATPEVVYRMMGFEADRSTSLATFTTQVNALDEGLRGADDLAPGLPGPTENRVAQLVGIGEHDGSLVGAVSLGDLDHASNVTVNVPGATTTIDDMGKMVRASNELVKLANARDDGDTYAMVSWIGYRAPSFPEVGPQDRARSGGAELAGFLDGVVEGRGGVPPASTTVTAHSYGSTTASEALQLTQHRVTSLVTYGSVGFTDGTGPDDLAVGTVYATEGEADHTARWGRNATFWNRTDPRDLEGVEVFSSDASARARAVTGHDMFPEGDSGKVGYLSPTSTSARNMAEIIAKGHL
jgi:hypothetical protein